MSDLISRQAAIETLKWLCKLCGKADLNPTDCAKCYMEMTFDAIKSLPSAEPKRGKWKILTIREYELANGGKIYVPEYRCECCLRCYESYVRGDKPIMPEDADFPSFCENCGADMR